MSSGSGYTITQLWVLAVGSGLAVAAALVSMPLTSPRTGNLLTLKARLAVALLPPLAAFFFTVGREARHGDDQAMILWLYSLAMSSVAATRLIFFRWVRRYRELLRSTGKPPTTLTTKEATAFVLTLLAVGAVLVVTLAKLPSLWT